MKAVHSHLQKHQQPAELKIHLKLTPAIFRATIQSSSDKGSSLFNGATGGGGGAFQNQILTFLFLLKVATTCLLLLILASRDEVLPHMTVRVGKARVTKGRFQTCWFHWSEPHPTRRLAKTQVGYRFNLQKVEALNKIRSPSSGARGTSKAMSQPSPRGSRLFYGWGSCSLRSWCWQL